MTQVIINDNIVLITSDKFQEIESAIIAEIRSWNNFDPTEPLKIEVSKTQDTNVLNVVASEEVKSADLFGRK